MSEEQANPEESAPQRGKAGRMFVSIIVLLLAGGTAAAAFLRENAFIADLLAKDEWIATVVGNFHPLVLHLPIGIIFLVITTECLGWISFGKWKPVTSLALFLAVVMGCLACITGLVDMQIGGFAGKAWEDHMWSGIIFVSLLSLAFLFKIWGENSNGRGFLYAISLFAAGGAMGFGSHIGGEKVHGALFPEKKEDKAPVVITKAPQDRLAYAEVVVPIVEAKCYDCHEPENDKGDLIMTTWEGLLAEGTDGPALVPGVAEDSFMIKLLEVPEDDDMRMPPKKRKKPGQQMEDFEIKLLKWWVSTLPKGSKEQPEDKTLAELGAPQDIIDAAAMLVSPEERKRILEELERKEKERAAHELARREAMDKELNKLKADDQLKNSVNYISQASSDLVFTAVSLRKNMGDDQLKKLAPLAEGFTDVHLGATSVTEAGLAEVLPKMVNLKKLNISQTGATDSTLEIVSKLPKLEWLNLYGTQVSDAGLKKLESLTHLKKIYLWETKATPNGAKALQEKINKDVKMRNEKLPKDKKADPEADLQVIFGVTK